SSRFLQQQLPFDNSIPS
ncbi:unnamed protein product, partial [Rotaria magnacalcarata]